MELNSFEGISAELSDASELFGRNKKEREMLVP